MNYIGFDPLGQDHPGVSQMAGEVSVIRTARAIVQSFGRQIIMSFLIYCDPQGRPGTISAQDSSPRHAGESVGRESRSMDESEEDDEVTRGEEEKKGNREGFSFRRVTCRPFSVSPFLGLPAWHPCLSVFSFFSLSHCYLLALA